MVQWRSTLTRIQCCCVESSKYRGCCGGVGVWSKFVSTSAVQVSQWVSNSSRHRAGRCWTLWTDAADAAWFEGLRAIDSIALIILREWMDERCFRPLLCTVKAELGRGQPGLMRWIWDETLPQSSIDPEGVERSFGLFCEVQILES